MTHYEGARLLQRDGETVPQVVNQWIRTSGTFDGVSDFDAAVREPVHPLQLGYKPWRMRSERRLSERYLIRRMSGSDWETARFYEQLGKGLTNENRGCVGDDCCAPQLC